MNLHLSAIKPGLALVLFGLAFGIALGIGFGVNEDPFKDINAAQTSIEKLGINITEGPITLPDGGVMFFIRDQDKNVIEFHQNG